MPLQKSQMHRLMRIAALLKENRYPNSETLVKEFRRMAVEEELEIECGRKTVLRDMKILENEFGCPLAFDRARNGYYLKSHTWDFIAPALLDENEMLAAVIGARIAEEIFPAPLKNKIRNAVDFLLQNNNPDFLDTANMEGLNILSGLLPIPTRKSSWLSFRDGRPITVSEFLTPTGRGNFRNASSNLTPWSFSTMPGTPKPSAA